MELEGAAAIGFWVFTVLFCVAMGVAVMLVDRPAKRRKVDHRRSLEGDLHDPRGRWDTAPKVDREADDSRR